MSKHPCQDIITTEEAMEEVFMTCNHGAMLLVVIVLQAAVEHAITVREVIVVEKQNGCCCHKEQQRSTMITRTMTVANDAAVLFKSL